MGLFRTKPGGSFLGNLTRAIGINKTPTPGFPAVQTPNQAPVPSVTVPGIAQGMPGQTLNVPGARQAGFFDAEGTGKIGAGTILIVVVALLLGKRFKIF